MNTLDQLLAALEFFSVGEFQNEVLDDQVRQAADMLYNQRRYGRETLNQGSLAVIYADHVTAQQQAEITRLNAAAVVDAARIAELEKELDGLSNSYATCGKPDCTPTQVCELFFNGCRS